MADEYPKMLTVTVDNEEEHQALLDGTAIIKAIKSAQGTLLDVVGIKKEKK